jgi:hypothetical protein
MGIARTEQKTEALRNHIKQKGQHYKSPLKIICENTEKYFRKRGGNAKENLLK